MNAGGENGNVTLLMLKWPKPNPPLKEIFTLLLLPLQILSEDEIFEDEIFIFEKIGKVEVWEGGF